MNAFIDWGYAVIASANTAKDGTGTVLEVFTSPEDIYVDRVVFVAAGSNVATCARLFINNGDDNATAANNSPLAEITLDATTLDEAAAFAVEKITTDLWLPKGYRLLVTLGTTVAAGYRVTALAGSYQDLQSFQSSLPK